MLEFDDFVKLSPTEVAKKTFISVKFVKAFFTKDFEKFNVTKAHGFIKIMQREYDVDLDEWLSEYEAYHLANQSDEKELFLVPKANHEEKGARFRVFISLLLIVSIIAAILYFFSKQSNTAEQSPIATSKVENLQEAKSLIKSTANVQNEEPLEIIEAETIAQKEPQKPIVKQMMVEKNPAAKQILEQKLPTAQKREFYVSTNMKLWTRIKFLDTGKIKDQVIMG